MLCLLLLSPWVTVSAQRTPEVRARFSTDSILLGDQFTLRVEVDKDMMQIIEFPEFDGYLGEAVEILSETPVDTLNRDGRRMTLAKEYLLTCFDPAIYNMGHFPVLYVDKNIVDTLWSIDSMRLLVNTFNIDLQNDLPFDIKGPMQTPMKFGEISGYILRLLLGLILLGILAYFILKWRETRRKTKDAARNAPPHVVAIAKLEKLDSQKLWQSGKPKLYYTALTDILREYMENRYGFQAMELTSAEIIEKLRQEELPETAMKRMLELLPLADMVKFAKMIPGPDDNQDAFRHAWYFVEDTKVLPESLENAETQVDTAIPENKGKEGSHA